MDFGGRETTIKPGEFVGTNQVSGMTHEHATLDATWIPITVSLGVNSLRQSGEKKSNEAIRTCTSNEPSHEDHACEAPVPATGHRPPRILRRFLQVPTLTGLAAAQRPVRMILIEVTTRHMRPTDRLGRGPKDRNAGFWSERAEQKGQLPSPAKSKVEQISEL